MVNIHPLKDAVVVLKKRMNALELIHAAWALSELSADLVVVLASKCTPCNDGKPCGGREFGCPIDPLDFATDIEIPDDLRELAGIDPGEPLHVELLDDGEITIMPNRGGPCLWDVPAPMMRKLISAGICPGSLDALLKTEEIIFSE